MQNLNEYIEANILAEKIMSTVFNDSQIDLAEYFDIQQKKKDLYVLTIYDVDDKPIGKIESSDADALIAYLEEEFDVDGDYVEIDVDEPQDL